MTKPLQITRAPAGPGGRPPKYRGDLIPVACALARVGCTDAEIMEELGIASATLYRWRNEHPEFREALASAKEVFDTRIERSLARRALGGLVRKVKTAFDKDTGQWHAVEYFEELVPDTAAIQFWLVNRQKLNWQRNVQVDATIGIQEHDNVEDTPARTLALAMLNLIADAQAYHTGELKDVTPNQAKPAPAPAGAGAGRSVRQVEHELQDGRAAAEDVEGAGRSAGARYRR